MLALTQPHGPAFEFLLLFGVVMGGPKLVERFRIPGMIGLLLGGFLIGENGLGLLPAANRTLPDLGQLGLLYLMFVAGLELDLTLVRAHRRSVALFSALTFALPMAAGTAVGFSLGWEAPAALLLGSLVASHTLVVYPAIRDQGLGGHPAVASAVGATIVTDTLALVVLAAVSGTEVGSGSTAAIAGELTVGIVVLVASCLLGFPRLAGLVFRLLGDDRPVRYLVAVVSFLAAAVVAEVFGIEGIVGAFFAGLGLNRLVPNEGPTMERIEFFGSAVFIPVFLVSVGLILDPGVMAEPATLRLAGLFIAACFGGKALAAVLTGPLLGFSRPEIGVMFALTIPQAAATLAATMVGFDIGLFGTSVVNGVLVLILASLIVAPLAANRFGRAVAVPEPAEQPLGSRVLLVLSDPDVAGAPLELAARIAAADSGLVLPVLLVPAGDTLPAPRSRHGIEAQLAAAGIDAEVTLAVDETLGDAVAHLSAAREASAVVVAGHDSLTAEFCRWEALRRVPGLVVAVATGRAERLSALVHAGDGATTPAGAALEEIVARVGQAAAASGAHGAAAATAGTAVPVEAVASWNDLPRPAAAESDGLRLTVVVA